MRKVISTDRAPAAIGPYAQAIKTDHYVFISGQLAIDPATNQLVQGGIQDQTRQALRNILEILTAAGCTAAGLVKTTVFLQNLDDFAAMNEIYADMLGQNPPARACVEVPRLPKDALVEIEAIAQS